MIQKMKGTVDILPQEIHRWQYVEDVARDLFDQYLYREIRTPIFEAYDLFSRSVGNSSDIVSKEMYDFFDKGERHISLRPEGTAGVVRAYIENKLFGPEHAQPFKVYYMGPYFRYERPQAGRQRQFNQLGVEVFGSENPATDVEVISLAWQLFQELGLKEISLQINSLGKPADRQVYRQALIAYLEPHFNELSEDSQKRLHDNPLRVLDSKDPKDKRFVKEAPSILDYLSDESKEHFDQVQLMLKRLNIPFEVNDKVVRGLDYYQDTIFEFVVDDNQIGAQSTVCGGGRYDGLVQQIGGPEKPGFGFGLGIERLLLLMDQQAVSIPDYEPVDLYILCRDASVNQLAMELVQNARQAGLIAERDYLFRSIKSQFKTAGKLKAKLTIMLGDQEVNSEQVIIKNQETGIETEISKEDLYDDFYGVYRRLTTDTSVIDKYFRGE
ncbi:histidine--tRNA ligase [Facklamia miroungae]|uniref:Histidine--tRNA ligase n=1 Tax=Facklamia miroungae TaxID=120956 RepID=A0A1G7R1W7_9LACT|nr:histidine--tRNA ligase [Facklamia miroungae]NKZ29123.1 histidine--tRNA ligase [Facklamia miroungae]SDG03940.1 histidyl-tRNA synthetase [Facklamia miroungae]